MIDRETGEVISEQNLALIKKEVGSLEVFDKWLDAKEQLLTAKERFEMVDKPFRKAMKDIFEKYGISRFYNEYIDVTQRSAYVRSSFDPDLIEQYIKAHGDDPNDFKVSKKIAGTLSIKYKDE